MFSIKFKGYYETAFDQKLPDECACTLQGCEFDYLSNTYRLQVVNLKFIVTKHWSHLQATLNSKTLDFATHYIVLRLDYSGGPPKLCSIRWTEASEIYFRFDFALSHALHK